MGLERLLPAPERAKTPERPLPGRVPASALWVASGIVREHVGKRKLENVEEAVNILSNRKIEDLRDHNEKIANLSVSERTKHWDTKAAENPELRESGKQVADWNTATVSYVTTLQKNAPERFETILRTLNVHDVSDAEDFSSRLGEKVEAFRRAFLDGGANIDAFAKHFAQGKTLDEAVQDAELAEPFFGVFGGKATAQLVKDAIIAHAYVDNLQHEETKPQLLEDAKTILAQELPEETAALYAMFYQDEVGMQPGQEVPLPAVSDDELVPPAPVAQEKEKEEVILYPEFQKLVMDRELGKFPDLQQWFEQEAAKLPEMRTEIGTRPMTDGKGWKGEVVDIDGEPQIMTVESVNKFFAFKNVRVYRDGRLSHDQPGLFEDTADVEIETEHGKVKLQTSGFVGVIKDNAGNILVGLGQEPLSNTPNHVVVKDPLQTSIGKFKLIMGDPENNKVPDPDKDKAFYDTISLVFPGDNPFEQFLNHLKRPDTLWAMGAVNGNRLDSSNISFEITVSDDQKEALTLDGKNRWVSEDERKALERAGLLNLIGTGAFTAA